MQPSKRLVGFLLASCVSPVLAQTNVGQVLDGGAEKLTAAEFKKQIVGRFITGPGMRADSGTIEVVYLDGGVIRGAGAASPLGGALGGGGRYDIEGTWTIDEQDRICQSIRIGNVALAPKCQYWFKQAEKYYLADSDSDRSARVSIRTVKKT